MKSTERIFINVHASVRKFLREAGIGVPLVFLQQASEAEPKNRDVPENNGSVDFLLDGPDIHRTGSKNDFSATLKVDAMVKTKIVESDVYYHQRINGRVVEKMSMTIPLLNTGGKLTDGYDKVQYGIIRPVPTSTIMIGPVSVVEPLGSIITQIYEIEVC